MLRGGAYVWFSQNVRQGGRREVRKGGAPHEEGPKTNLKDLLNQLMS
jgi:hypothetical protein